MEIIIKDITTPRLTIAVDRVTLKIPKFRIDESEAVIASAILKVKEIGSVTRTFRFSMGKQKYYNWSNTGGIY